MNDKFFRCTRIEYFSGDYGAYISDLIVTNKYICIYLDKQFSKDMIGNSYYMQIGKHVFHIICKYASNYIKFYTTFDIGNFKEGDWIYITDSVGDFWNKELWWEYLANESIKDIQKVDLILNWL